MSANSEGKRLKIKECKDLYDVDAVTGRVTDVIVRLNEFVTKYGDDCELSIDTDCSCYCSSDCHCQAKTYLYYYRDETDKELERRLAAAAKAKAAEIERAAKAKIDRAAKRAKKKAEELKLRDQLVKKYGLPGGNQ